MPEKKRTPTPEFDSGNAEAPAIETSSEVLANGSIVELVRNPDSGVLALLLCEGQKRSVDSKVECGGQWYRVAELDPSVARIVPLPSTTSDYGSTEDLFAATFNTFSAYGFSPEIANACTFFVFADWCHSTHQPPPILTISGPPAEATLLMQLLACVVRRGVTVADSTSGSLAGIVEQVQPTLIVDARNLSAHNRRLLAASCRPAAYIVRRGAVVDLGVPKVVYLGAAPDPEFSLEFALHVHLSPLPKGHRLFTPRDRQRLLATIQPQLLEYRVGNLAWVRSSDFDVPDMTDESRVIARVLGSSIVNAPDLQSGVRALVENREIEIRENRFADRTCIVIEALFAHCHDPKRHDLRVKELAEDANAILKARGEGAKLEARAVGEILNNLRVRREARNSRGRRILFNSRVNRNIHKLARDYEVESIEQRIPVCTLCKEILGGKKEPKETIAAEAVGPDLAM